MLQEKILHSAAALFAEKGFDDVLVDDIAAGAGVGKGSVYRRFSSKEELYTAIVIQGYSDLRSRIGVELASTKSVVEAVTKIVKEIVLYFWNRLDFFDLLRDRTRLPKVYENQYLTERRELVRIASDVLVRGANEGAIRNDVNPQLLAESLLGIIRGIQRYGRGAGSLSPQEVIRTIVMVFFDGAMKPSRTLETAGSGVDMLFARLSKDSALCRPPKLSSQL